MKKGVYQKLKRDSDTGDEKLIRIHLLISVHPNNEAAFHNNRINGDYEILILNPKCQESVALTRQIAIIRPKRGNEANK